MYIGSSNKHCRYMCTYLQEWSHISWQHPLKATAVAQGLLVVLLPLILYTDDLRGNLTRKWNKFDIWYLLLGGLPGRDNAQFRNIHFLTCSNNVSALELSEPIVRDLERLEHEGVVAYDALLREEVK